jgi:hypothetical protein
MVQEREKDWGSGDSDRRQTGTGTSMSGDAPSVADDVGTPASGTAIDAGAVGGGERAADDPNIDRAIKAGATSDKAAASETYNRMNRAGGGYGSGGPSEEPGQGEGSGSQSLEEMLGGDGEAEPRH